MSLEIVSLLCNYPKILINCGPQMYPGGIADKLGNRYEAKWLVCQLLNVILGNIQSIRFEGINPEFKGFEAAVRKGDVIEWHQTKINNPNGNWTITALHREGVLAAFKSRLEADSRCRCVFVSQDPAKDMRDLAEKSRYFSSGNDFRNSLGSTLSTKLNDLITIWGVDTDVAFSWLTRCEFRTESQASTESLISAFSDLCFLNAANAFSTLREFLESNINKEITTESARRDIRSGGELALKDWSLDPTLIARLDEETSAYLNTYTPFGMGGTAVPRSEAHKLTELVGASNGANVILLSGVAGSGKSGVIREFIGHLQRSKILHLALRIDQHLDCSTTRALGKAVTARDESPASTLKGLAPLQTSVLIIDQVDAVSEVSGRNGAVRDAVLRLVDETINFGSVRLVIVCRSFDLDSDERLKALKSSSRAIHINVDLLDWKEVVEPLLSSKSIDIAQFSEKQRDLLRLPLNLSIFFETFDSGESLFTTANDLFSRLLEKKARSIKAGRHLAWELIVPLSKMAEWMSEQQRLDAPEELIAEFPSALDILSSEGLIVRSRGRINFFHESLFDYIYARTFCNRSDTLVSILLSSEQHLFRRTQVRQILETLRQTSPSRYLTELRSVLHNEGVRFHIKVAVAQWLGSLSDPRGDEKNLVLELDSLSEPFPQLVRRAFLNSPGWFDILLQDGLVLSYLKSDIPDRTEVTLWWLGRIAGQRPAQIAALLDRWWGGNPERGKRLLNWFSLVTREMPDTELVNLCARVIRFCAQELFGADRPSGLLLHSWKDDSPSTVLEILTAYFDAWYETHPGHHPFENDLFHGLDEHGLGDVAERSPKTFAIGSVGAFSKAVDLISQKETRGEHDYSFKHRAYSGHHYGADAFLNMLRSALKKVASREPDLARQLLKQLDPLRHEANTHIWLETIEANVNDLHDLLGNVLESPYLFDAGWDGAAWKSFSDVLNKTMPLLNTDERSSVEEVVLSHQPELIFAREIAKSMKEGEHQPWVNREAVIHYLNQSGFEQWCVLESIGVANLSSIAQDRLAELRRKFSRSVVPDPRHFEAHWVGPPIKRDKVVYMADAQWLRAIEHFHDDDRRRYGRTFIDGGARELAGELQHLAKDQPARFARLLDQIPDSANETYVSHILWGLIEATDVDEITLNHAVSNAHQRPGRPHGSSIVRLIEKNPAIAADASIFETLLWYAECGEVNEKSSDQAGKALEELVTIDDLLNKTSKIYIRGLSGVRGEAAEALGNVLWNVPALHEKAFDFLERRATTELSIGVRCCLMRALVPLYNCNRNRCAALAERISRVPGNAIPPKRTTMESAWRRLAFPRERLPSPLKRASIQSAKFVEHLAGRDNARTHQDGEATKWWYPLLTPQGTYLLPFLLSSVPESGIGLVFRLIASGEETSRMVGAWHIFRRSFGDASYAPLADALMKDGVTYKRLMADVASHAVSQDEFRYRAEDVLCICFADDDKQVRSQAANVFRNIKPAEVRRFKPLINEYLASRAFSQEAFAFFNLLKEAECRVDDIVVVATKKLIDELAANADSDTRGRRSMDLHLLQDIIKREYVASESDPELRRRILDLIDRMLWLELYGVDEIIKTHER